MAKKKRQRISYVLPLANSPGGHRLGVNGLTLDHDRDILYTGGRDGVICAWNLEHNVGNTGQENGSLPSGRNTASFRQQIQAHTHWVNDLVLVKSNLAVVSASSDASVKLWRPHSQDVSGSHTIGHHSDYIKCLASPSRSADWVASGGLDHRIKLWDLSGAGENLEIDVKKAENVVKGSVYALRVNHSMIASGGPEGVVRIWDVNSGKSITKLVGHTDNVRDILISDDSDTILTASSDQTIKVWSVTAGRCLHTLTMHNDSVWCMYSDDPSLSVFYSGDRSGLVAKTDTRRAMEIEEGVSVAVCQERDGIMRLALAHDSLWTATSSSSINRWQDVDTELEVETPPPSPRHERRQSALSRSIHSASPPSSPPPTKTSITNGIHSKRIPHTAVLRLSNVAIHPGRKQTERSYSVANIRKASEAILDPMLTFVMPIRGHPEETIRGQNGLTRHVMLNDKKRVLTLDTAGEVVLWDLLECIPVKSFGRRHIDEVVPEVNTQENVANWCTVDTKTGKLTVMLEENYCFDAELYADELEIKQKIDFREDQRINLGKWVLRNLFATLLDEELRRDVELRKSIQTSAVSQETTHKNSIQRLGAPTSIVLPESSQTTPMVSPGTLLTPRASQGLPLVTPGLAIGMATPGGLGPSNGHSPLTRPLTNNTLATTVEEVSSPGQPMSPSGEPMHGSDQNTDYFSSNRDPDHTQASTDSSNEPHTPTTETTGTSAAAATTSPMSSTDDKRKSLFSKKFQMPFPKKLGRTPNELAKTISTSTAVASDEKSEDSDRSSEKDAVPDIMIEDNFYGVLQRIERAYKAHFNERPDDTLPPGITPSMPIETPVLTPPSHTTIIIQEDDPESGGLTDLYRGVIANLGREASTLEKIAPAWLGELLLRNQIPEKDTVKVSFVLHPYEDEHDLPPISSPDGNSRLNANRMLRAKKILAYVAERIDPVPSNSVSSPTAQPHPNANGNTIEAVPPPPPPPVMKPEEYLELICQGQKVDPNMTLGTLRVHVWRGGGDVVLYYRANGKKKIKTPHPADVATSHQGMGAIVTTV